MHHKRSALISLFCSLIAGLAAGLSATAFQKLLSWANDTRTQYPHFLWLLPVAGFLIGWAYHRYGKGAQKGLNLIIEEIQEPKNVTPFRTSPLILLSSILTHLVGGSAGREGAVVQMGASLADQISRYSTITGHQRKVLLSAAAGASFGAAIGAPFAGVIFGMEMITIGRFKIQAIAECLIASFTGYYFALALGISHFHFPKLQVSWISPQLWIATGLGAIFFGLGARAFVVLTDQMHSFFHRFVIHPSFRPFFGGLLLLLLFQIPGSLRYAGLGLDVIEDSFRQSTQMTDPFWKIFFTSLTVGSGFKGGEFIPLLFTGVTMGSALTAILGSLSLPMSFLPSLGFAAIFGAASNTPITCTIMAIEIFGYEIGPYALTACLLSSLISGKKSIYSAQK